MEKQKLASFILDIVYLNDEQLKLILNCFQEFHYKKSQIIVKENEVNKHMNFIDTGCLRSYFLTDQGQEVTRHIVFENDCLTGLKSFLTQEPSAEILQAMEDTSLYRISYTDFNYLLNIIPAWEKFFRYYLQKAYINNIDIFQRETTKDAFERYEELLKKKPELVKRLPHKIVASYLNMTSETLSRVKRRLSKQH